MTDVLLSHAGRAVLVIALFGCSGGHRPSSRPTGTAGAAGQAAGSAGASGTGGVSGVGGGANGGSAGDGGANGAAGAVGSGGGASGGAGVAGAAAGMRGSGGSGAGGSFGSPTPCGSATCDVGLACARGACLDTTWASWRVPPDVGTSYHDNGDGTVTDSTGLMWEKAPTGAAVDVATAVAACTALTTGAYADWRLPSITELLSIVDYGKTDPALSVALAFQGAVTVFLSATPSAAGGGTWSVDFRSGESDVASSGRRRCVR